MGGDQAGQAGRWPGPGCGMINVTDVGLMSRAFSSRVLLCDGFGKAREGPDIASARSLRWRVCGVLPTWIGFHVT